MNACEECLRASATRSEAMTLMEQRGLPTSEVAQALELPMADVLARLGGEVVEGAGGRDGFWTICRHCDDFPAAFTHFPRESDVPLALYGIGRREAIADAEERRSVALVGARRASAYGREVAYSLANEAASRGLVVVSGMALGIDGAAHRGALQAGGQTIAVLAGGPDRPYPRSHRLLYEQILASGCVLSENPPGVEARRWAFIARNRLIAGLSTMTVWVEGAMSSGARHTFDFAEGLGHPVGAVPGPVTSPMSAGTNARLGQLGVTAVLGIDSVLEAIEYEGHQQPLPGIAAEAGGFAAEVLERLGAGERTPRDLALAFPDRTQREISRALGQLELAGRIVREPSGEYRRQG